MEETLEDGTYIIDSEENYRLGLFGFINNSEVKGINVYNVNIEGYKEIGTIIGRSENSKVSNLNSYNSNVIGFSYIGGVIGHMQRTSSVKNVVSYATVEGVNKIGGTIGSDSSNKTVSDVENIKSYASIICSGSEVGEIVGLIANGTHNYNNIYSKSVVKGNYKVGGVIGGFYDNYEITFYYKNIVSESDVIGNTNYDNLYAYINSATTLTPLTD